MPQATLPTRTTRLDPDPKKDLQQPLKAGKTVHIQPTHGRQWKQVTVESQTGSGEYKARTPCGQSLTRNRINLRTNKTPEHHTNDGRSPMLEETRDP